MGGIADLLQVPVYINILSHLGYPAYFAIILGGWKVLAVVGILAPGYPRLKEWAYAGLIFIYSGAIASRIIAGDGIIGLIGPVILSWLAFVSWAFRSSDRSVPNT